MARVSILMPAFNAVPTIEGAIASVQGQSETDWELLVIDDASQDDTAGKVRAMADMDPRIVPLSNTGPKGAAGARNTGLHAATGRYIAFLDADDAWLPRKLEKQLAMLEDTNAALCFCGYVTRRAGRADKEVRVPASVTYDQLLRGNVIGCLTAIYDTDKCGKVAMPLIRRRHDFALWLAIVKTHGQAVAVREPLAILRLASGTLSSNKIKATYDTWRMYRYTVGLSAFASLRHTCQHVAQRLRRA